MFWEQALGKGACHTNFVIRPKNQEEPSDRTPCTVAYSVNGIAP